MPTEKDNAAEAVDVKDNTEQVASEAEQEQAAEVAEGAEAEAEAEVAEPAEGEQPEKPAAGAKPKPGKPNPFRSRISELTAEKRALEAQLAEARRAPAKPEQEDGEQAEQPPNGKFVPVNVVNDLVRQEAAKLTADRQFDNDCNAAFEQGTKAFPDFEDAMANFNALGGLERDVIEDALATGAAHRVLYELGSNPDRAAKLLKMPSKQRVAEFTKMTLKAAPKQQVSGAAPPIKPLGGNAKKDFDPLDTSISDEEWHRQEDERELARRRA